VAAIRLALFLVLHRALPDLQRMKPGRGSVCGPVGASEFLVSLNLHRRHLNESQRAIWWRRLANVKVGGESFGKFAE
jgi:hypothetical protein